MAAKIEFLQLREDAHLKTDLTKEDMGAVFPLSRFFSANRRFVGARANNFRQYSKHSFRKFDKFVEI